MRAMRLAGLALLVGFVVASAAASAHHSFSAAYFEDQSTSIEGDVVQFDYRNPHAWVHLTVTDERGEMQKFSAEWANPARLKQQGVDSRHHQAGRPRHHYREPGPKPGRATDPSERHPAPNDGWNWPRPRTR